MKLRVMFKEINGDLIPYLWACDGADNPDAGNDFTLKNEGDWAFIRDHGSNRARAITLLDSRDAAESLVLLACEYVHGRSTITEIDEQTFAVGTTMFDGTYDSGIPVISDARRNPNATFIEIDVDAEIGAAMKSERLIERYADDLEIARRQISQPSSAGPELA